MCARAAGFAATGRAGGLRAALRRLPRRRHTAARHHFLSLICDYSNDSDSGGSSKHIKLHVYREMRENSN
ncbi:unnamed protein product [Arctia plantaginis]|uniref:Uncharacterized protein n=1 Tax=Arctia plantaginis TaxID=874455 RepID=A0A8S1ALC3_ARCPL|nr:unnamed protein product [Arctia plantaginis]